MPPSVFVTIRFMPGSPAYGDAAAAFVMRLTRFSLASLLSAVFFLR